MKRLFILLTFVLSALSLSAQKQEWRTIDAGICLLEDSYVTFTSGTQYNDKFYFGFGSGLEYTYTIQIDISDPNLSKPDNVNVGGLVFPVFVDGKYRFFDTWCSPSFRLRAGALLSASVLGVGGFVRPELGIDFSRHFTIAMGWNWQKVYTKYGWYSMSASPLICLSVKF